MAFPSEASLREFSGFSFRDDLVLQQDFEVLKKDVETLKNKVVEMQTVLEKLLKYHNDCHGFTVKEYEDRIVYSGCGIVLTEQKKQG